MIAAMKLITTSVHREWLYFYKDGCKPCTKLLGMLPTEKKLVEKILKKRNVVLYETRDISLLSI